MPFNEKLEDIISSTKTYLSNRTELTKLKAVQKGSKLSGEVLSKAVILLLIVMTLLMISAGCAIAVGIWLGNYALGFFAVAVFYLIIALLFILFRDKWIQQPVENIIIRTLLKDEEDDES